MVGYIYKSVVAEKVYIGKTTSKLDSRIKTHLNHAFVQKFNMKISQALRTLSKEDAYNSFSVVEEIIADTYDELEKKLCDRENYWMNHYNSFYPNGYNVNKSVPSKQKNVSKQPPREKVMREVVCVETGEHFSSMTEAAKSVNVNVSALYHCLKGQTNRAGGKHWRYANGEYHECHRPEGGKNKKSQSKPVMCKETGIVYPSTGEAERQTGICRDNISSCALGQAITAGGYKWGYIKDGEPVFHEVKDKNRCKIKCVETGEIFNSIAECARSLGEEKPGTLQSTIKHGCKHKGLTYIKIN